MIKKGHTLSETLIALSVVGIIAALMMPLANKIMPDRNKMLFLKSYDTITKITRDMAENTKLYPIFKYENPIYFNYNNAPLLNTDKVTIDGVDYEGVAKYCKILAKSMGEDSDNCSSAYEPNKAYNEKPHITAKNGSEYWIYTDLEPKDTDTKFSYQSNIYIDVDGIEKGKNCQYDSNSCPLPDRFTLYVAANAMIFAADEKSQHYLDSRTNTRVDSSQNEYTSLDKIPDKYKILEIEKLGS